MKTLYGITLILAVVLLALPNGFCADTLDDESVAAIQNRIFARHHEIDLGLGYIPDDDFYELFPVELGYTYHFNNYLAWNVAKLHWVLHHEKDLKKDLEKEFGASPEEFDLMVAAIHTNIVVKPFYGKSVSRRRKIINHEMYAFAGGGVVNYETQRRFESSDTYMAPSISFGIGQKFFIGQKLCLNLELRDWVNFKEDNVENNFWFGISLGYRFNLSPRQADGDKTVEAVSQYLE
jgi:outer membrane beta-barrel protein